jgi:norsolorinic acid ketoreductase
MGNSAAVGAGMEEAPTPLEEGVEGIVKQLDKATREETSRKFVSFNGDIIPW